MSEKIKGKCYQEHEPTPNNPCEIKTILCNDIEIPVEYLKQTFVTVDGKKYIELQQENQQLKGKLDNNTKIYLNTSKYASECEGKMVTYKYERDLYKSVIDEAREYVNNHIHQETFTGYMDSYELKKLLQILDKVKV